MQRVDVADVGRDFAFRAHGRQQDIALGVNAQLVGGYVAGVDQLRGEAVVLADRLHAGIRADAVEVSQQLPNGRTATPSPARPAWSTAS